MSYNAADITELDDVQHTRLRPAVNLGLDVLNTALRELVDNAIEEVADPSHGGSTVTITLHADGSVDTSVLCPRCGCRFVSTVGHDGRLSCTYVSGMFVVSRTGAGNPENWMWLLPSHDVTAVRP